MRALSARTLSWLALLLALASVERLTGAEKAPPPPPEQPTPADAQTVAHKIDQLIAKGWVRARVKPARRADDAEWMRRVYLDLVGRIPSVSEARTFLADKRSDKRARLVNQLLARPLFARHFTNVWRALLIPEANNNFVVRLQQRGFEAWLKKRIARNAGYDEIAHDLITTPIVAGPGALAQGFTGTPSSLAFYSAKEFRPENLAAGTARVFLGVSVECAQCHNHPFAEWKRDQFWSFAAFYSGIRSRRTMDILLPAQEVPEQKELTIPGTRKVVQATYLDGAKPEWKSEKRARRILAKWVTSPDNPYFSRAAVNRQWAYFLGAGLVEPIDEMAGATSTASHPEVLDLLAREFVAHKFDQKFLIRVITATRAYQLTSAGSKQDSTAENQLFARALLRGLTAEQLFDSVAIATGYRDSGASNDLITGILGGKKSARSEFLTRFHPSARPTQSQTSILQALSLMNGKVVAKATSLEHSETLAAIIESPFVSTETRLETLYLATLSRKPTAQELKRVVRYVENATHKSKNQDTAYSNALADVFWALLNSSEFFLNH